ncbi:Transposase-associated domain - like 1 [Theobroma cacao]|nr:Transposase-associated domain - like 1 [Theobroma cacao]
MVVKVLQLRIWKNPIHKGMKNVSVMAGWRETGMISANVLQEGDVRSYLYAKTLFCKHFSMNLDSSVKMIDKSWMCCSRLSKGYIDGVRQFLDFAFANGSKGGLILCPCKTCNNCLWKD